MPPDNNQSNKHAACLRRGCRLPSIVVIPLVAQPARLRWSRARLAARVTIISALSRRGAGPGSAARRRAAAGAQRQTPPRPQTAASSPGRCIAPAAPSGRSTSWAGTATAAPRCSRLQRANVTSARASAAWCARAPRRTGRLARGQQVVLLLLQDGLQPLRAPRAWCRRPPLATRQEQHVHCVREAGATSAASRAPCGSSRTGSPPASA